MTKVEGDREQSKITVNSLQVAETVSCSFRYKHDHRAEDSHTSPPSVRRRAREAHSRCCGETITRGLMGLQSLERRKGERVYHNEYWEYVVHECSPTGSKVYIVLYAPCPRDPWGGQNPVYTLLLSSL